MDAALVDAAATFGAIAVILAATGAIGKFSLGVYRIAKRIDETNELVQKELQPNGGGSLHDAIQRIDERVEKVATRVEVLEGFDRRNEARREQDDAL